MCGIVGYVGNGKTAKDVVKILKKLEYRGYDSAGITNLKGGELETYKAVGNISNLEKKLPDSKVFNCAIAHTRWATHGEPNEINAHPHASKNGDWVLVHNGIIENYKELKKSLKNTLKSETDTCVVAELLEEDEIRDIQGFINVFQNVQGSYAIVAESKFKENELFLARRKSPLYITMNDSGEILVASDPICFVGFSKKYYIFKDMEFADAKLGEIIFYNEKGEKISKEEQLLGSEFSDAEKQEYPHFMIKEIMEQPEALKRQIKMFRDSCVLDKFTKEFFEKFNKVEFIGCGTAYNASLIGARYIERLLGVQAKAQMASEFIYNEPVFADEKSLFVFVSQSGETADTLRAFEIAKEHGATCIALTNVLYSSLAKMADYVIPVCAGPEIAVASTKAYVCQLSALYMLSCSLRNKIYNENIDYFGDIKRVADNILNFSFDKLDNLADNIKTKMDAVFIGKDLDYVTAGEASLKLKEVAYINSSSYPSGELKHGYLALVEKGTPLIVLANSKRINQKTFNSASEAESRGAEEIILTNDDAEKFSGKTVFHFSEENELLLPMLTIAPLQYMAYRTSVLKGINPDQPRNLAKSVTVE